MTSSREIDSVRAQANIVAIVGQHVKLRKEGHEFVGCCPFHTEKTASFKVDPKKNGGVYICFGCGAKGDVFRFVQMIEGLDFKAAIQRVKDYSGMNAAPQAAVPGRRTVRQPETQQPRAKVGPVTAVYTYLDEKGDAIFEVCRHEPGEPIIEDGVFTGEYKPKAFRQRVPMPGGYSYSVKGVRRVLYRLPQLQAASEVWLVEGEKDVHTLEGLGLTATTNAGGAKAPWLVEYSETLKGKDVIIIPDNDEPGRARGDVILNAIPLARLAQLPEGFKDVTDYIAAGHTVADLRKLVTAPTATQSTVPDLLPELLKAAIDSHDPRKAIDLAPLIARTEEVRQAKILTEIYNSFGKELNRNIFMQVIRSERKKAAQEERERSTSAVGADWTSGLIRQSSGSPRPILANAIMALEQCPQWAGVLAFNEFTSTVILQQKPPLDAEWSARQPWSDQHDRLATEWFQANNINVNVETTAQAIQTVGMKTPIHPVRNYLNSVTWDGESRIDRWVFRYLGVPQDDVRQYAAAVGKRFLVSAVARIFRPGCKADCAVILEGEQGIRKSTALKTLAGEWFTDEIADFGSKDAALQMQGAWIIELSELDNLNRSDIGRIKAFMSRTNDRFRPPYGRHVIELARQCVFAGSVNNETYLRDETGNRRFWPLRCGEIRIAELKSDRDQLWAEAVHCFKEGHSWWLDDPELISQAEEEQGARVACDPWQDLITKWIEERLIASKITVGQVLEEAIGKKYDQWARVDEMRVGNCLLNLGFIKKREARDGNNPRRWLYERNEVGPDEN